MRGHLWVAVVGFAIVLFVLALVPASVSCNTSVL
jgi:hypothetical protein